MSTSRKTRDNFPPRSSPTGDFKGFANIALPQGAKEIILGYAKQDNAFVVALDGLQAAGFKVSFPPVDDSDCYNVSAMGAKGSGKSAGYVVSARSKDQLHALLALSFKVFDIADGDLSSFAQEKRTAAEI